MLTRLTPVATLTDTEQQSATTSFSTQKVTFSWHWCNRRDARVESYPCQKNYCQEKVTSEIKYTSIDQKRKYL